MSHAEADRYRPVFHLAPPKGWCNDPVGFIHWQGLWHLFYQHHPHGPCWGPMHWGHGWSADLIAWEHLPIALTPDSPWDQGGCFSGSAIEGPSGELLLMYTGVVSSSEGPGIQAQCLAASKDGIRFQKASSNPVIPPDHLPPGTRREEFRDPRLIRRAEGLYALIGSCTADGRGQVLLFRQAPDTLWQFVSVLLEGDAQTGTMWECPDLFTLGDTDVLVVSPQYMAPAGEAYHNLHSVTAFTGRMDWSTGRFHPTDHQPLDWGFDFYAPQTAMAPDGRRLLVAWMDMWEQPQPTAELGHGWAGHMTLPRELSLSGDRICCKPIRELKRYRKQPRQWPPFLLAETLAHIPLHECFDLEVVIDPLLAPDLGLTLFTGLGEATRIRYHRSQRLLELDITDSGLSRTGIRRALLPPGDGRLHLRILRDRSSLEVFANQGAAVLSARIFPRHSTGELHLWAHGNCAIISMTLWSLEVDHA